MYMFISQNPLARKSESVLTQAFYEKDEGEKVMLLIKDKAYIKQKITYMFLFLFVRSF